MAVDTRMPGPSPELAPILETSLPAEASDEEGA